VLETVIIIIIIPQV